MSTKEPTLKKGIEERADSIGVFGVDATGAKHKYCAMSGLLVVERPDGEIEYTKAVSPDRITARDGWINFVEDRRGWVDQWFTESLGLWEARDRRLAAIRAAQEASE